MKTQLECRIVLTFLRDGRVEMGMYDPRGGRYEPLGIHGPGRTDVDRAVEGLKDSIVRAGHHLTFCERSR